MRSYSPVKYFSGESISETMKVELGTVIEDLAVAILSGLTSTLVKVP